MPNHNDVAYVEFRADHIVVDKEDNSRQTHPIQHGYKLLRMRRDGTLGPLFIHREQRIPIGEWLTAEDHKTKGYAHRPGWHVTGKHCAPHLSTVGRVWAKVEFADFTQLRRPKSQGGTWYLANYMKVVRVCR